MHAPLPPSMVPVGWEYPAHLLQQDTIRAGEPAQGAYSAADSVAAPQPGQAQQVHSPSCFHTHLRARARLALHLETCTIFCHECKYHLLACSHMVLGTIVLCRIVPYFKFSATQFACKLQQWEIFCLCSACCSSMSIGQHSASS